MLVEGWRRRSQRPLAIRREWLFAFGDGSRETLADGGAEVLDCALVDADGRPRLALMHMRGEDLILEAHVVVQGPHGLGRAGGAGPIPLDASSSIRLGIGTPPTGLKAPLVPAAKDCVKRRAAYCPAVALRARPFDERGDGNADAASRGGG